MHIKPCDGRVDLEEFVDYFIEHLDLVQDAGLKVSEVHIHIQRGNLKNGNTKHNGRTKYL